MNMETGKSEDILSMMSNLCNIIANDFNISDKDIQETLDKYKIKYPITDDDFNEKSSTEYKNSIEVEDDSTSKMNHLFSKYVSIDHEYTSANEKEMFETLDECIFRMNADDVYANSIVVFKYTNMTFAFKWNKEKEVYCLVYANSTYDEKAVTEKLLNANLDFKDYNNDVISYYDQYSRSMKPLERTIVSNINESSQQNAADKKELNLLDKVEVSNEITAETIYKDCNTRKDELCIRYLPNLYKILDGIFKKRLYKTFTSDVENIDFITFDIMYLRCRKDETSTNLVNLYQIYTARDLEQIIKKRYQFKNVEVVRKNDDEPLRDAFIKCYLV